MSTLLEGSVPEPVIGGALLAIRQALIGFVEFLEFDLRGLVAGIAVGMMHHGGLAKRRFQVRVRGRLHDAKNFIIVAFGHGSKSVEFGGNSPVVRTNKTGIRPYGRIPVC